ncbi:MAG: hypothetical protein IKM08_00835 [Clostridia bacterium]|nr:hypothetical protein [Clostridia bacterium]
MQTLKFDLSKKLGSFKILNATNGGPWHKRHAKDQFRSNFEDYKAARIPYSRNHDSGVIGIYGGPFSHDVTKIFPRFEADVNDPASYDFACTDESILACLEAGTQTFFRLGETIEHQIKKHSTIPPADFQKWAEICEHIIRHYNEGWADGLHLNMQYWEIWNEPDLDPDDSQNKRTWGGTKAQFFEFYHIAATHLKAKFPHLKIGGPAIAGKMDWAEDFLAQLKAPLDFFSWHVYAHTVEKVTDRAARVRALLDKYGFTKTESILNEWNYVLAWETQPLRYSHRMQRELKGASFNLAVMTACQQGSVDMLMYYDARPTGWNGLFDPAELDHCYKAYYAMFAFNELYKLGEGVKAESVGDCGYALAARKGDEAAVTLCHYDDDDNAAPRSFAVDLCGFGGENGTELEIYLLDDTHDLTLTDKVTYYGDRFVWEKELPVNVCYLLKLKKK